MAKKQQEIVEDESHKFNKVQYIHSVRPNGSLRIQQDYTFCPTMAEQHTAHLTNINYLIKTHKPDELAAYLAARSNYRREILGHDFSREPSLQDAKNEVYRLRTAFEKLPDEVRNQFRNHVEFLKFIDNPENQEKMIRMGLLTKKEVQDNTPPTQTTTQEEDKAKGKVPAPSGESTPKA